ncbi:MAG: hypothetical protein WEB53_09300 [Akkermansiaceae bacterium]
MKPPVYALYRKSPRSQRFVVIQERHHETGEQLPAVELGAFIALKPIRTGYFKITVGTGSTLFLTPAASKIMSDAGTLAPLMSETLVHWRDGEAAAKETFRG